MTLLNECSVSFRGGCRGCSIINVDAFEVVDGERYLPYLSSIVVSSLLSLSVRDLLFPNDCEGKKSDRSNMSNSVVMGYSHRPGKQGPDWLKPTKRVAGNFITYRGVGIEIDRVIVYSVSMVNESCCLDILHCELGDGDGDGEGVDRRVRLVSFSGKF